MKKYYAMFTRAMLALGLTNDQGIQVQHILNDQGSVFFTNLVEVVIFSTGEGTDRCINELEVSMMSMNFL